MTDSIFWGDNTCFAAYVAEQEKDPEFKAALDAERERLRRELDEGDEEEFAR